MAKKKNTGRTKKRNEKRAQARQDQALETPVVPDVAPEPPPVQVTPNADAYDELAYTEPPWQDILNHPLHYIDSDDDADRVISQAVILEKMLAGSLPVAKKIMERTEGMISSMQHQVTNSNAASDIYAEKVLELEGQLRKNCDDYRSIAEESAQVRKECVGIQERLEKHVEENEGSLKKTVQLLQQQVEALEQKSEAQERTHAAMAELLKLKDHRIVMLEAAAVADDVD